MSEGRRKAYRKGHRAEWLAAATLMLKGYRVLERRFKTPVGEIDLIVRKGTLIAFVEVKARRTPQEALDAVGIKSQQRISKAGAWWISRQRNHHMLSWRYDVVAICPRRWPVHYEQVW